MGKKWKYIGGILVALIVLAGGYGYYFLTCPCSEKESEVAAPLKEKVEIVKDELGVPHIFAQNEEDLFFAMGYVVASDRLFQMDLTRRAASGEIAEILGKDYADYDYFIRRIGLRRAADGMAASLSGEPKLISEAFNKGVNHYITTHAKNLPLEFTLLGYNPRPWTSADSYSIARYMAWDLSRDYEDELYLYKLVQNLGPDVIPELFPPYPKGFEVQIPEYENPPSFSVYDDSKVREMLGWGGPSKGSNNWVVSGKKTESGYPLLANDPHLGLSEPGIWYEIHLVGAGFNVYGTTIPGVPAIVIGHNENIAWGLTNVGADVQDLYIEKINPKNDRQYWYMDHWEDMKVEETRINVKGEEPVVKDILFTRHGPVVSDANEKDVLSLQWTAHLISNEMEAFIRINRARNLDEFKEGLKHFTVPAQNFVYADTQGNIAYFCNGKIPIRKKGMGILPVDGSTGEYEWTEFIPWKELPHIVNPEKGFVVTSNVKIVPDSYPYYLFYSYVPPYRFQRIVNMLKERDIVNVEYMKQIQSDTYSLQAEILKPKLLPLLDRNDADVKIFAEGLEGWDNYATPEEMGPSIYFTFVLQLLHETYADELGDLYEEYLDHRSFAALAFANLIENDSPFFDVKNTYVKETKREIVNRAAKKSIEFLREQYGTDWRWGRLHTMTFEHPVGSVKPLNYIYNIGPLESPGGSDTVNNGEFSYAKPFAHKTGPSLRMIVDFSDMGNAMLVIPTGQGGSPFCENYKNMTDMWLTGKYHTMRFTAKDIRAHAHRTLWLVPG